MAKIRQIPEPIRELPQKKKVAAYARISMESEMMFHSFSAQVSHYSQLIQSNPDWQYAGVYADRGHLWHRNQETGRVQPHDSRL